MMIDWIDDDELDELGEELEHAPVCRVCGCSEFDPCVTRNGSCFWLEPDLCSGCAR